MGEGLTLPMIPRRRIIMPQGHKKIVGGHSPRGTRHGVRNGIFAQQLLNVLVLVALLFTALFLTVYLFLESWNEENGTIRTDEIGFTNSKIDDIVGTLPQPEHSGYNLRFRTQRNSSINTATFSSSQKSSIIEHIAPQQSRTLSSSVRSQGSPQLVPASLPAETRYPANNSKHQLENSMRIDSGAGSRVPSQMLEAPLYECFPSPTLNGSLNHKTENQPSANAMNNFTKGSRVVHSSVESRLWVGIMRTAKAYPWVGSSFDLVVLILSRAGASGQPRRDAVRQWWALQKETRVYEGRACSIRFIFVVGDSHVERLEGDVLHLNVEEGYRNISKKVLFGMRWVYSHMRFKFLLKTDDDAFVCLSRLILEIAKRGKPAGMYYGKFVYNPVPVSTNVEDRMEDSAYIEKYHRNVYPSYAQGAGYVLSFDLVKHIASKLPLSVYTVVEDALVATLLHYSTVDFEEVNERNLISIPHRTPAVYCKREFVLLHHLAASEISICAETKPMC